LAINLSPKIGFELDLKKLSKSLGLLGKTMQEFDYDLVIVGGNIVGATLALALKGSGLKILLVEYQSPLQALNKKQAYAFSLLSREIYSQIGLWPEISSQVGAFREIRLSDGDYPATVNFDRAELNREHLGYVSEHYVILTALYQHLESNNDLSWASETEVIQIERNERYCLTTIKSQEQIKVIKSRLVVGADGAKSPIRQQAGITTRGWKYWQSCLSFTIKHQLERNDIAFERFSATGPMGILPLPDNRYQIVWTNPHDLAQSLLNLDENEFLARFQEHTNNLLGEVEIVSPPRLFPVQLLQSDHYILSRLALIGDAAHCCHPVGGQGLNQGIRDAASLAQVLKLAHNSGEDIGEINVLKRYENWRKKENMVILGFTDLLNRTFSTSLLPIVLLRRLGLESMRKIQPLKIFALKLMTGLKGKKPQLT
jgi:2-octaprenyl-6-methoxyphenol hydroxylase